MVYNTIAISFAIIILFVCVLNNSDPETASFVLHTTTIARILYSFQKQSPTYIGYTLMLFLLVSDRYVNFGKCR